ncbi:putative portal protein [Glutamicibacter phage BIM BV-113]|nr:putative portal protein [Glutamicibacter phage BIM BV-113]
MGLRSWLGFVNESGTTTATETVPTGTVATLEHQVETLAESMAQLALAREDVGWERILQDGQRELTPEARRRNAELCRIYAIANPLIKRGLELRAAYVFGQGVGTTATGEEVNDLVQTWLDDPEVREVFAGSQAQARNELALGTDGNVFFALFTNPLTGRVKPRVIPFEEIQEQITDPEDSLSVRYYKRVWNRRNTNGTEQEVTTFHPRYDYRPQMRERRYGATPNSAGHEILWDAPIYHVKVNAITGWQYGIGDAYAALPWARGYKEFLESWAVMMNALSKIVWQRVGKSGKRTAANARRQLEKIPAMAPGGSADATDDSKLEAVPKTGATIDSESAKPLAAMVATALGIPVTMLLADPGQTGARAVAETLDKPTELTMLTRQDVWREARRQLLGYVIDQAIIAPRGPLRGTTVRDGDRLLAVLPNDDDRTLTITFPDISKIDVKTLMEALEKADGHIPPLLLAELIMRALNVRDVDEWLAKLQDEDGNFIDPLEAAGQAAADAFRRGEDPSGEV